MQINLKENQKALIIGDIHGCYDEMIALIKNSGIDTSKDIVVTVGDIVDRGDKAFEVVKYFSENKNAYCILGNHEIKHIKKDFTFNKEDYSGWIQRQELEDNEYSEIIKYFKTLPIYLYIITEKSKYLIVHAGITKDINIVEIPQYINDFNNISNEIKTIVGTGSRGRYGFKEGEEQWYDTIPKKDYTIVYGHRALDNIIRGKRENVFGLDTNCCTGNNLSGLLLPEEKIIEVKSNKNYYNELIEKHSDSYFLEFYKNLSWKEKVKLIKQNNIPGTKKRIEKEFTKLELISNSLNKIAEDLRNRIGRLDNNRKAKLGRNWNKVFQGFKIARGELKKAFFRKYKKENLYKYSKEDLELLKEEIDSFKNIDKYILSLKS